MKTAFIIVAALALAACGTARQSVPPSPPTPDKPKTVTEAVPVAASCVDKAFPHMPAEPTAADLLALPDFAARDDQVKGHWPGLADWALHAEAQINLCR